METEQLTEEQLIDFAEQYGCEGVTHWKLERWHKQDVIPRPIVEHLGYGRGTRSVYPAQTSAQVLAVCRLLKSTRNFDVVRFQLWQEGYFIPFPIQGTEGRTAPIRSRSFRPVFASRADLLVLSDLASLLPDGSPREGFLLCRSACTRTGADR